jgi:hypothetical protein
MSILWMLLNGLLYPIHWEIGCMSGGEVSADGSHFSSRSKPDPRERQIDEAFLARNYRQDSAGHFHVQPTPTSSMFPRNLNDGSRKSKKDVSTNGGGDQPSVGVRPEAPQLEAEKSDFSDKTDISSQMEPRGTPVLFGSDATAG